MKMHPKNILTEEEKEAFVRSFVMKFSRGNILLQIGKFVGKKEADEKCLRATHCNFTNL